MYASVWVTNPGRVMKVKRWEAVKGCTIGRSRDSFDRCEQEHTCWDPKDSELCVLRVKPGESLVEARSDTDVQIVRPKCVKRRKTNRAV